MKCFCVFILAASNAHVHQAQGNAMSQGDAGVHQASTIEEDKNLTVE
jgi:hypothetical protein